MALHLVQLDDDVQLRGAAPRQADGLRQPLLPELKWPSFHSCANTCSIEIVQYRKECAKSPGASLPTSCSGHYQHRADHDTDSFDKYV